jgi:hypothetical protein
MFCYFDLIVLFGGRKNVKMIQGSEQGHTSYPELDSNVYKSVA